MSQMNEMTLTIEDLRKIADAIRETADRLSRTFGDPGDPFPAVEADAEGAPLAEVPGVTVDGKAAGGKVPEGTGHCGTPGTLSKEELKGILARKSREGHTDQIRELLMKYGASCVSQLDPKYYGDVLKETEGWKNAT